MKNLLIVSHSPSVNSRTLTEALISGASSAEVKGVSIRQQPPLQADAEDVQWADALILGTTENFGYMSGAMKDFFDRIYYPCMENTDGLPYALLIKAGLDGQGAQSSIERIITGLRWKQVQETLICQGEFNTAFIGQCEKLGMTMAAGLEAGIF